MRYRSLLALATILFLASGCDGTVASDEAAEFSVSLMGSLERSFQGDGVRYTAPELIFLDTEGLSVTLSFFDDMRPPTTGTYPVIEGGPDGPPPDAPGARFSAIVVADGIAFRSVSGEFTITEDGGALAGVGTLKLSELDEEAADVDAQISFRGVR